MRGRTEKIYDDLEDLHRHMLNSLAIIQNPMPIDRESIDFVKSKYKEIREDFNILYSNLFAYLEDVCLDSKTVNGEYARTALKLLEQSNEIGMDGDYDMAQCFQDDGEYILKYLHSEDNYMLPKVKKIQASLEGDNSLTESIGIIGPEADSLFGYPLDSEKNQMLCNELVVKIKERYSNTKFSEVRIGATLGFNYLALIACIISKQQLKQEMGEEFLGFEIEFVLPYKGQHKDWSDMKQTYYKNMASLSDKRTCVEDLEIYNVAPVSKGEYHPSKIDNMNLYIINKCSTIITYSNTDCTFTQRAMEFLKNKRKQIIDVYMV